jgi:flavin-dependent dehydrogenase
MEVPTQCDVVVIGGGPAGSLCGSLLAEEGFDVVLLEKAVHPRYQVGESLIPHFWKFCDLAGLTPEIEAEGFLEKAGGTIVWNGEINQMAFKDFGYERPALHVERDRFDLILLNHARKRGVRVFEEVAVTRFESHGDADASVFWRPVGESGEGENELRCRYTVDASGQDALLARQLGLHRTDPDFRFMSMWGYYEGSSFVALDGKVHPAEMLTSIAPTTFVSSTELLGRWGWVWQIPLRETTSVGMIVPMDRLKAAKAEPGGAEGFFRRICSEVPLLQDLLAPARYEEGGFHLLRNYSHSSTAVAGPGFFLIGDAAAFVDPVLSAGVTVSLYSAWLCAWTVARCLRSPERVASHQDFYTQRLVERVTVYRSLVLPAYEGRKRMADDARRTIRREPLTEQALMAVATALTDRSVDIDAFVDPTARHDLSSRFRTLEGLEF